MFTFRVRVERVADGANWIEVAEAATYTEAVRRVVRRYPAQWVKARSAVRVPKSISAA